MSEREALLRAVAENPDDDAPRLVYADWLDEHGDPRQAEFIRVQIELARLPDEARRGHPLAAREQALWRELRKWRFLPPNWVSLHLGVFHRGFNVVWHGDVPAFLRVAGEFWRHGPIQIVNLHMETAAGSDPASAAAVAALPALRQLRGVHVKGGWLTDEWVEAFLRTPYCDGWTRLALTGDQLTDAACRSLAASRLAGAECTVVVDWCAVTELGRRVLEQAFGHRQSVIDRR